MRWSSDESLRTFEALLYDQWLLFLWIERIWSLIFRRISLGQRETDTPTVVSTLLLPLNASMSLQALQGHQVHSLLPLPGGSMSKALWERDLTRTRDPKRRISCAGTASCESGLQFYQGPRRIWASSDDALECVNGR